MNFKLECSITDSEWDDIVAESQQGSVFCQSHFLSALGDRFDRFVVCDGDTPVAIAPICATAPYFVPYQSYTTFRFAIYQGPMFSAEVDKLPLHTAVPYKLKIIEFLMRELEQRYDRLCFTLHPNFSDARAFQWHNYHDSDKPRCAVHLRYTSLLDIGSVSHAEHFAGVRELRRREYRRAAGAGIRCEITDNLDVLDYLEDQVYERQDLQRDLPDRHARRAIAESALRHDYGLCVAATLPDGRIASAYLCVFDRKTAYYLFAGNDPDTRKSGASTFLLFHCLELFRNKGQRQFDLIGLNSPARGDFKTSFNAVPTPHYLVTWSNSYGRAIDSR